MRAGAILPTGPVKQSTAESSDEPLTFTIYPGRDGSAVLYEDDGATFDYLKGAYTKVRASWKEASRKLTLETEPGTTWPKTTRTFRVAVFGGAKSQLVAFDGSPQVVEL